jgi:chromosome partitioning protein
MKNFQSRIAVCNQKGGVGKSAFTVLIASYLHYNMGHDVLVMDCDYPQWSIHAQRERELEAIEHSDYYKLMMVRQFKATGRKIWPVIRCMPSEALGKEESLLQSGYRPRIILYDLPGTVNSEGVLHILSSLDSIFIPLKADKLVMESSLAFARSLDRGLVHNKASRLQNIYLFWTMVDRRERTPLYDRYEAVIQKLELSIMATHVPYRSKFNKELLPDGTGICRSTLLAPERTFAREAQIEALAHEILTLLKIR